MISVSHYFLASVCLGCVHHALQGVDRIKVVNVLIHQGAVQTCI